jgi:hypothetical protein
MHDPKQSFINDLSAYIGYDYLEQNQIMLDDHIRFDQLKFDLVDEVVAEYLVCLHFGLQHWQCDEWPATIRDLLSLINHEQKSA